MTCELCDATIIDQYEFSALLCGECLKIAVYRRRKILSIGAALENESITPATAMASFKRSAAEVEAANPEAWKTIQKWRGKKNLYIFGPMGTGKSYAARCLLNKFIGKKSLSEVTASDALKFGASFDEEDQKTFRALQKVELLLLDDLDKVSLTKPKVVALWKLLNYRNAYNLRTIITANMPPVQLAEYLAKGAPENTKPVFAALDRIQPLTQVEFKGKSLRRTHQQKPLPAIYKTKGGESFCNDPHNCLQKRVSEYVLERMRKAYGKRKNRRTA